MYFHVLYKMAEEKYGGAGRKSLRWNDYLLGSFKLIMKQNHS